MKQQNIVQIALQNIQLMPVNSRHFKSKQLIKYIIEAELNVFMMNEIGLNWSARFDQISSGSKGLKAISTAVERCLLTTLHSPK